MTIFKAFSIMLPFIFHKQKQPNRPLSATFYYNPHTSRAKKPATIIRKSKTRSKSENAFHFENQVFAKQKINFNEASFAKSMLTPHPIICSVFFETTCSCGTCQNTVKQNLAVNLFADFALERAKNN